VNIFQIITFTCNIDTRCLNGNGLYLSLVSSNIVIKFINVYCLSTSAVVCHIVRISFLQSSDLLGSLLDRWFDKMDSISLAEKKKLATLALLSLLTSTSRCVI